MKKIKKSPPPSKNKLNVDQYVKICINLVKNLHSYRCTLAVQVIKATYLTLDLRFGPYEHLIANQIYTSLDVIFVLFQGCWNLGDRGQGAQGPRGKRPLQILAEVSSSKTYSIINMALIYLTPPPHTRILRTFLSTGPILLCFGGPFMIFCKESKATLGQISRTLFLQNKKKSKQYRQRSIFIYIFRKIEIIFNFHP